MVKFNQLYEQAQAAGPISVTSPCLLQHGCYDIRPQLNLNVIFSFLIAVKGII